jgi:hypothetical protein
LIGLVNPVAEATDFDIAPDINATDDVRIPASRQLADELFIGDV